MVITPAYTPNYDERKGLTPQIITIHIAEGSKESVLAEFRFVNFVTLGKQK